MVSHSLGQGRPPLFILLRDTLCYCISRSRRRKAPAVKQIARRPNRKTMTAKSFVAWQFSEFQSCQRDVQVIKISVSPSEIDRIQHLLYAIKVAANRILNASTRNTYWISENKFIFIFRLMAAELISYKWVNDWTLAAPITAIKMQSISGM